MHIWGRANARSVRLSATYISEALDGALER
jgi:hypothetical protein